MSATSITIEEHKRDLSSLLDRITDLEDLIYGVGRRTTEDHLGGGNGDGSPRGPYAPVALGNPAPLGLLGFAVVSFLSGVLKISSDELGRTDGVFAGTALFIGGVSQVIAGFLQYVKNETHSGTTFSLYGLHWIAQGFLLAVRSFEQYSFSPKGTASVAAYFSLLTFATFVLWLPTFRMNKILTVTLGIIMVVFTLDAIAAGGWRGVEVAAGVASCTAAAFGFYLAILDLVNETWKRPILPLFPHKDHMADYDDSVGRPWVPRRQYHKSSVSSVHL